MVSSCMVSTGLALAAHIAIAMVEMRAEASWRFAWDQPLGLAGEPPGVEGLN